MSLYHSPGRIGILSTKVLKLPGQDWFLTIPELAPVLVRLGTLRLHCLPSTVYLLHVPERDRTDLLNRLSLPVGGVGTSLVVLSTFSTFSTGTR